MRFKAKIKKKDFVLKLVEMFSVDALTQRSHEEMNIGGSPICPSITQSMKRMIDMASYSDIFLLEKLKDFLLEDLINRKEIRLLHEKDGGYLHSINLYDRHINIFVRQDRNFQPELVTSLTKFDGVKVEWHFVSQELVPCPFCGDRAEFERLGTGRCSCIIVCQNCGCRLESGETGVNNGDKWNRRCKVS